MFLGFYVKHLNWFIAICPLCNQLLFEFLWNIKPEKWLSITFIRMSLETKCVFTNTKWVVCWTYTCVQEDSQRPSFFFLIIEGHLFRGIIFYCLRASAKTTANKKHSLWNKTHEWKSILSFRSVSTMWKARFVWFIFGNGIVFFFFFILIRNYTSNQ